jgi:hypothetical protein
MRDRGGAMTLKKLALMEIQAQSKGGNRFGFRP